MCAENVLRLASIDCSSPMSANTVLKTGSRDPAAVIGGQHRVRQRLRAGRVDRRHLAAQRRASLVAAIEAHPAAHLYPAQRLLLNQRVDHPRGRIDQHRYRLVRGDPHAGLHVVIEVQQLPGERRRQFQPAQFGLLGAQLGLLLRKLLGKDAAPLGTVAAAHRLVDLKRQSGIQRCQNGYFNAPPSRERLREVLAFYGLADKQMHVRSVPAAAGGGT